MPKDVRVENTKKILNKILRSPTSRVELAEEFGLTKTTVGEIVKTFLEKGVAFEERCEPSGVGRPVKILRVVPNCAFVIGLALTRDEIAVCVMNAGTEVLVTEVKGLSDEENGQTILRKLEELVEEMREKVAKTGNDVKAMTVAVPGPVDAERGVLLDPPNFPLKDVPLSRLLEDKFGFSVWVENDADMGAIGEYWASKRDDTFIYVLTGKGIGAGIVVKGELYRGPNNYAGELGHIRIFNGKEYVPLEWICGKEAVEKRLNELGFKGFEEIWEYPRAFEEYLEELALHFGIAILNAVHMFGISNVVVGGFMKRLGSAFLERVKKVVEENLLYKHHVNVEFSCAQISEVAFGAAVHALQRYLEDVLTR